MKRYIAKWEKRIEELQRLPGMDSKNPSKPPSCDPSAICVISPRRRAKKRGAKNGHQRTESPIGEMSQIGQELYDLAKKILKRQRQVRDGTLQWGSFSKTDEAIDQACGGAS